SATTSSASSARSWGAPRSRPRRAAGRRRSSRLPPRDRVGPVVRGWPLGRVNPGCRRAVTGMSGAPLDELRPRRCGGRGVDRGPRVALTYEDVMALQGIQHPEYVGAEVDAGDAEHVTRVLRFFLRDGERVVALATTVKALPTLTHIAVTDRRILGFSAAELAKEGPRQETDIAVVASVETRKSSKQRWFFVVVDESGAETDFGDVHDQDVPRHTRSIAGLVRPSRPEADVPSPRLPEADTLPRAPEPGAPSPHTPGAGYVISNIGAFGERMVKIGMTRRLEP